MLFRSRLTPEKVVGLTVIDDAIETAIQAGDVPAYLTNNHRFHFELYETSGAQVLIDMSQSLWLRFGPSLRVVSARYKSARMPDRHSDALAAMRASDGRALAEAIRDDIAQGIDLVRQALLAGEI